MALIINEKNLNTQEYVKIIDDRSYITKNGIYTYAIVYKDEKERIKEKERINSINSFLSNLDMFLKTEEEKILNKVVDEKGNIISRGHLTDEILVQKLTPDDLSYLGELNRYKKFFDYDLYRIMGTNIQYNGKTFYSYLTPAQQELVKKLGFQEEWFNDPIHVMREEETWISEYDKSNFDLNNFYTKYKNFHSFLANTDIIDC